METYPTRYQAEAAARIAEMDDGRIRKVVRIHPVKAGWAVVRTGQ